MKTLFLTMLMIFFVAVNAQAETTAISHFSVTDGAHYRDGVGTTYLIKAEITDEKELIAEMSIVREYPFPGQEPTPTPPPRIARFTKKLGELTYKKISSLIQSVSNIELNIIERNVICHVVPSLAMNFNQIQVLKTTTIYGGIPTKEMRLLKGPRGCWVDIETAPKHSNDQTRVTALQNMIQILAMDAVGI